MDKFEEKTITRQEIYNGKVIQVVVDDVSLPNGQRAKRELVFHQGAVGIIAVTPENKLVLVKQYRKAIEQSILEIPAGKIEKDEPNALVTAMRELEEETHYRCESMNFITKFVSSPGFSNEWLYLYEAVGLYKISTAEALPQDDDEFLELIELSLEEAKARVDSGEICDAKTQYAILYLEMQSK
ncbi:ADP-ribose pyrophosphatase [Vagococcus vulneris]|uniref:ADP-ribose pyrophosphatase n=2 Tax=Vagococcus vulneris TaxID=1977869 RepID=A0A429ZWN2_9ENTE|nr:ADP-ribose pyrophosphatase [Vagococcus vulneris]